MYNLLDIADDKTDVPDRSCSLFSFNTSTTYGCRADFSEISMSYWHVNEKKIRKHVLHFFYSSKFVVGL